MAFGRQGLMAIGWVSAVLLACSLQRPLATTSPASSASEASLISPLSETRLVLRPISPDPTASLTPFPTITPTHTPVVTNMPEGACVRPPENYERVNIGAAVLNQRTYWMLQQAQALYGGTIPITGAGITQGSYNPGGVTASFGTHDGGGVVDLTVRNIPYDYSIKWDDLPRLIEALRLAGFAAFYRDEREGLSPHIHAIAIGDTELSPAAAEQLTGYYGYFRGFDGYPREDGIPRESYYGELIICQWMLEMGYRDMRGEPLPVE